MSDADFKNSKVEGFKKAKLSSKWKKWYAPDLALKKGKTKTLLIMESSTTGDRKTHIGELFQFLSYVNSDTEYNEYYFVLFLGGKGKNSPTESRERDRLQFYYEQFPIKPKVRKKIKGIYVKKEGPQTMNLKLEEIKLYKSKIEL